MDNNVLKHYGRKGMKWGQHIFGNKKTYKKPTATEKSVEELSDEALNSLNKRYASEDKLRKTRAERAAAADTVGRNIETARSVANEAANASNHASSAATKLSKMFGSDKNAMEAMSKMSDTELRAVLNRMQMESQYAQLNPSRASRGAAKTGEVLAVVGSVAATTASVAYIVSLLRNK